MDRFSFKSIIQIILVTKLPFCFCFCLFVCLFFFNINECTASSILLVHTAVFAILGTLITRKDAQVRKKARQGNVIREYRTPSRYSKRKLACISSNRHFEKTNVPSTLRFTYLSVISVVNISFLLNSVRSHENIRFLRT